MGTEDSGHGPSQCAREVQFTFGTQVQQPGGNEYLNWLYSSVGSVKDTWECLWVHGWMIFVFGAVCSFLINFAWLVLLYFFAWLAVWTCVWMILLSTFVGTIFCLARAGAATVVTTSLDNSTLGALGTSFINSTSSAISGWSNAAPASDHWLYWVGAIALAICFLSFSIFVCCSCKAIGRCIELVKQSSLVIGSAPALSVLPLFTVALQLGMAVVLILTLLVLTTVGTYGSYGERLTHVSPTEVDTLLGLYLAFGGIWGYAFLTALEMMTVAAVVFYFYFVNKKTVPESAYMSQYDDNQTSMPVLAHLGWVLRYHIGTLAFGSLVVAIVTVIQITTSAAFKYLENNTPAGSNFVFKLVARCIECCLQCFKKTIEFINSYAYIYCFVENIGFCSGCMKTFGLITRYPGQIAINTSVQLVLSTLLSVTTPIACTVMAFFYFAGQSSSSHSGVLLPGVVFAVAFLLSRAFAAIWEQVIQSLTVCVLHDIDTYDGRFLRDSMRDAFDKPEKAPPAEGKAEPLVAN